MDLVPMEPSESEDQKTYKNLVKKMKIAVVFTVPIFAIAMIEMMPNNPLLKIMDASKWNWVQLILITSCSFLCVLDVLCSCF
jgi:Cu+-exporting ATPase